jgi:esterase/lipase superfamily enzyme
MNFQHHRWYSPSLRRDMELMVVGHAGARVLVFPTSLGNCYEWLDRRMHEVLGEHLERGWIQLFCMDQVHGESWYGDHLHPGAIWSTIATFVTRCSRSRSHGTARRT